jgi:hypothetical protein
MAPQDRYVDFADLSAADLIVDATYRGGTKGDVTDDPLNKLLPGSGNQGGFRAVAVQGKPGYAFVCLYSSLADRDWPDYLDTQAGTFTYYGDNKRPGHRLEDTPRGGNRLLSESFAALHAVPHRRQAVPPFFIFTKGERGRDVVFRGLAVPGAKGLSPTDDLVAVWKSSGGERFQNYKAIFTILDEAVVSRAWVNDLRAGNPLSSNCPAAWKKWVATGVYLPLQAPPVVEYRTKEQQLPAKGQEPLVLCIYDYFKDDPYSFEHCAAELACLVDSNIAGYDLTRPWVDGGRDAVGKYRIGLKGNDITVDFALEAKCYALDSGVGVKETSRLISRLRYRQFGIFVTTSYVSLQAYKEIKEDGHPVLIISSGDIARLLVDKGYGTPEDVQQWLLARFPRADS